MKTQAEKNLTRWLKANDQTATPAMLESERARTIRVEQITANFWHAFSQRHEGAAYPVRVELSGELPNSGYVGRDLWEDWSSIVIARCACVQFHKAGSCKHTIRVVAAYADVFSPAWAMTLGFDANDSRARQAAFAQYFTQARQRDEARRASHLRLVAAVEAEEPGALDIITDWEPRRIGRAA